MLAVGDWTNPVGNVINVKAVQLRDPSLLPVGPLFRRQERNSRAWDVVELFKIMMS